MSIKKDKKTHIIIIFIVLLFVIIIIQYKTEYNLRISFKKNILKILLPSSQNIKCVEENEKILQSITHSSEIQVSSIFSKLYKINTPNTIILKGSYNNIFNLNNIYHFSKVSIKNVFLKLLFQMNKDIWKNENQFIEFIYNNKSPYVLPILLNTNKNKYDIIKIIPTIKNIYKINTCNPFTVKGLESLFIEYLGVMCIKFIKKDENGYEYYNFNMRMNLSDVKKGYIPISFNINFCRLRKYHRIQFENFSVIDLNKCFTQKDENTTGFKTSCHMIWAGVYTYAMLNQHTIYFMMILLNSLTAKLLCFDEKEPIKRILQPYIQNHYNYSEKRYLEIIEGSMCQITNYNQKYIRQIIKDTYENTYIRELYHFPTFMKQKHNIDINHENIKEKVHGSLLFSMSCWWNIIYKFATKQTYLLYEKLFDENDKLANERILKNSDLKNKKYDMWLDELTQLQGNIYQAHLTKLENMIDIISIIMFSPIIHRVYHNQYTMLYYSNPFYISTTLRNINNIHNYKLENLISTKQSSLANINYLYNSFNHSKCLKISQDFSYLADDSWNNYIESKKIFRDYYMDILKIAETLPQNFILHPNNIQI